MVPSGLLRLNKQQGDSQAMLQREETISSVPTLSSCHWDSDFETPVTSNVGTHEWADAIPGLRPLAAANHLPSHFLLLFLLPLPSCSIRPATWAMQPERQRATCFGPGALSIGVRPPLASLTWPCTVLPTPLNGTERWRGKGRQKSKKIKGMQTRLLQR